MEDSAEGWPTTASSPTADAPDSGRRPVPVYKNRGRPVGVLPDVAGWRDGCGVCHKPYRSYGSIAYFFFNRRNFATVAEVSRMQFSYKSNLY